MKLVKNIEKTELLKIIDHADRLCKTFAPDSDCCNYIQEKISGSNSESIYLESNKKIIGLAIIEIVDRYYGNLIVHTIDEENEILFAKLLANENFLGKNILELIQFRSNFNYRDTFIQFGLREKERVRMSHQNISVFEETSSLPNITFDETTIDDNEICGSISFNAHKHRMHIECYDVYSSNENRTKFANDLRKQKHGKTINEACVIMKHKDLPIGLIEVVHVNNFNQDMGWIMDVALLPQYQGMGYGKHLIKYSLSKLSKQGYSAAGLGVTLTNKNAHQLYESIGFEDYENFVEIIGI